MNGSLIIIWIKWNWLKIPPAKDCWTFFRFTGTWSSGWSSNYWKMTPPARLIMRPGAGSPHIVGSQIHRRRAGLASGESHICRWFQRLRRPIEKYYPGTQLTFNEINLRRSEAHFRNDCHGWRAGDFAKYQVYMSALWPLTSDCPFISAAYKIFRNFDGKLSTFGDLYCRVTGRVM